MELFHEYMKEYQKQLKKGTINKAYKGLMEYIMSLKTYLKNKYPDYFVPGSIYYGYMDMTYFSVIPPSLKQRDLKIALVFIHETCKFEAWLAGINKQVQKQYWQLISDNHWNKYHLVSTTQGADSIIEFTLVENPDFSDLDLLTNQIELGLLSFIKDIEDFLATH